MNFKSFAFAIVALSFTCSCSETKEGFYRLPNGQKVYSDLSKNEISSTSFMQYAGFSQTFSDSVFSKLLLSYDISFGDVISDQKIEDLIRNEPIDNAEFIHLKKALSISFISNYVDNVYSESYPQSAVELVNISKDEFYVELDKKKVLHVFKEGDGIRAVLVKQ